MKSFFWTFRDWWGRWAIDRAGVEEGSYTLREILAKVEGGEIGAHTWLRHVFTRRYALAGEILAQHGLASDEQYERWFPKPDGGIGAHPA
ncbi:MAG: hypothetical protein U0S12_12780 [Fimbriimonadales bacterium]